MYIERIIYKNADCPEGETGYLIGLSRNSDYNILVDAKFRIVDEVWDIESDLLDKLLIEIN